MAIKIYNDKSVLEASKERVSLVFDNFEKIYISFSGGKDSSVMSHLVLAEAKKRNRKVGLLIIDLEAQYSDSVNLMGTTKEGDYGYITLLSLTRGIN